jgi:hypothetical protein
MNLKSLETIIHPTKKLGENILVGTLLTTSLIIGGCEGGNSPQPVVIEDTVVVDPAHIGMIEGKVLASKVENNEILYEGLENACVFLEGTNFEAETIREGVYSIDKIPTGSYIIVAWKRWINQWDSGPEDTKSITVRKQETTIVPDLKLIVEPILKGKIYDRGLPFANEKIDLYGGTKSPWEKLHSTTTSSDGSYAFERSKSGSGIKQKFCLKTSEAVIRFWDTDTEEIFIPHNYDIVEKNAYVSESK